MSPDGVGALTFRVDSMSSCSQLERTILSQASEYGALMHAIANGQCVEDESEYEEDDDYLEENADVVVNGG